jgi:hypothetical protein
VITINSIYNRLSSNGQKWMPLRITSKLESRKVTIGIESEVP